MNSSASSAALYNAWRSAGLSDNQARIMMAETGRENSWNLNTIFVGHPEPVDVKRGVANPRRNFGLISWNGDRRNNLINFLSSRGLWQNGRAVQSQATLDAMAQFAVIGLGSFGATVATQLVKLNHDVIGIDSNKKFVENIADQITHAVIADATDEHVLEELNIQNCDAVVVAIGEDIEASILCVLNLKNLGISKIYVKAKSKAHTMILTHLGVSKIIHPEEDMGVRIAQSLSYPMVSRYMSLNDNHYIVKVIITDNLHGIRIHSLMSHAPEVKLLLFKRAETIFYTLESNLMLQTGDILVVEGQLEPLKRLSKQFKSE